MKIKKFEVGDKITVPNGSIIGYPYGLNKDGDILYTRNPDNPNAPKYKIVEGEPQMERALQEITVSAKSKDPTVTERWRKEREELIDKYGFSEKDADLVINKRIADEADLKSWFMQNWNKDRAKVGKALGLGATAIAAAPLIGAAAPYLAPGSAFWINPLTLGTFAGTFGSLGWDYLTTLATGKNWRDFASDSIKYYTGLDPRNNVVTDFLVGGLGNPGGWLGLGGVANASRAAANASRAAANASRAVVNSPKTILNASKNFLNEARNYTIRWEPTRFNGALFSGIMPKRYPVLERTTLNQMIENMGKTPAVQITDEAIQKQMLERVEATLKNGMVRLKSGTVVPAYDFFIPDDMVGGSGGVPWKDLLRQAIELLNPENAYKYKYPLEYINEAGKGRLDLVQRIANGERPFLGVYFDKRGKAPDIYNFLKAVDNGEGIYIAGYNGLTGIPEGSAYKIGYKSFLENLGYFSNIWNTKYGGYRRAEEYLNNHRGEFSLQEYDYISGLLKKINSFEQNEKFIRRNGDKISDALHITMDDIAEYKNAVDDFNKFMGDRVVYTGTRNANITAPISRLRYVLVVADTPDATSFFNKKIKFPMFNFKGERINKDVYSILGLESQLDAINKNDIRNYIKENPWLSLYMLPTGDKLRRPLGIMVQGNNGFSVFTDAAGNRIGLPTSVGGGDYTDVYTGSLQRLIFKKGGSIKKFKNRKSLLKFK